MKTLDLYLFLNSFTITVAGAAVAEYLRRRERKFLMTVVVALAVIPVNAAVGPYLDPETTFAGTLRFLIRERDSSAIVAVAMGIAAAVVWGTRYTAQREVAASSLWSWFEPAILAVSICVVVAAGQAYLWKEILGVTRHAVRVHAPGFRIEKIADLDDQPLRMAAGDEGDVFICFDYFKKHGAMGGAILRLWPDPNSREFQKRTVVESPFLARCYGLTLHEGDLYVCRSGFFPQATMGEVSYASTGAVTQLKDLDGDGYFEYAHDVISNLPGVRAPDTMQQNNGLVFAPDGSLFVTQAGAADRTLDEHPWGGTILKFRPDFTNPEVYAKGFRNPWTIAVGPEGELFVTDSDVDKNPGDEINHVVHGEHYGHPYVIPNEAGVEPIGFRDPILVGERETVFLGMAYATSPSLPEEFRNCLYVTDFRQNRVLRIELVRSGDTFKVLGVHPFATVPTPVDLAISSAGEFFVMSRRAQKVYRISMRKASS